MQRNLFIWLCLALFSLAALADIPSAAKPYQRLLTRTAHQQLGLDAPVATLAAQVHQESRWQADAKSPAGAEGMAQFMPATSRWMNSVNPELGQAQPWNPAWSLRAMVSFDHWLLERTTAADRCEHWAFVLSAYNGGIGFLQRDIRAASKTGMDTTRWFDQVANVNSGRSQAAFAENRYYVAVILTRHEPLYQLSGWGQGVCAEQWPS